MTVKELISTLQAYDPDAPVYLVTEQSDGVTFEQSLEDSDIFHECNVEGSWEVRINRFQSEK